MQMQKNVPLADFSTFRIGGIADFFVKVQTKQEVKDAVFFAKEHNIPLLFLGGGSNILFSDDGFRGIVVKMENRGISFEKKDSFVLENMLRVGAGTMNIEVYRFAKEKGLDFSPFYTVPGTLGGAVIGNAGIPDGEIQDFFVSAESFDTEKEDFVYLEKDFFDFSYRHTVFHTKPHLRKRYILFSVLLQLPHENPLEIEKKAKAFLAMRKEKQPWGKTGGSFFKNPKEGSAGYFLERAGFKGFSYNNVFFSEKHANFMMNSGKATQKEILALAHQAQTKVFKEYNVLLEPEVRILDAYGNERNI